MHACSSIINYAPPLARFNSDCALFWCRHDSPAFSDALSVVKALTLHFSRLSPAFARSVLAMPDLVNTLQQLEDRGKENPTEITERLLVLPMAFAKAEFDRKSAASAPVLVVVDGLGIPCHVCIA
jgi:hypothetical protein